MRIDNLMPIGDVACPHEHSIVRRFGCMFKKSRYLVHLKAPMAGTRWWNRDFLGALTILSDVD